MAIIDINSLIGFQWDKSNLWDIAIEDMKFQSWGTGLPANDVQLGFFGIANEAIGSSGLDIPNTRTIPTLTLSYIDDEELTVTNFFKKWLQDMVSLDGVRVQTMETASKQIVLQKLKHDHSMSDVWVVNAFPTGNLEYHGDSDGSVPIYSVAFTVTGGDLKI